MKLSMRADCFYCGEYANTQDHVIPYSRERTARRKRAGKSKGYTIPACSECNGILGSRWFSSIAERATFVNKRITQKYRKALDACSSWGEEELNELEGSLAIKIRAFVRMGQIVEDRERWQWRPKFYSYLEELQDEIRYKCPKDKFITSFFLID